MELSFNKHIKKMYRHAPGYYTDCPGRQLAWSRRISKSPFGGWILEMYDTENWAKITLMAKTFKEAKRLAGA